MKKIRDFIQKYQMITKGDKIVAGISGGADSVCLFFVLLELKKELDFDFFAVHVNHGLRGAAADYDEHFVRELCARYNVLLEVFHVDLECIAKKRKQSLEEAGRQVRREAFEKVCVRYGANKIALAHHQNDNAETFLLNLSRGTGLRGMGSIRPVNGRLIRPLLCMTRQEVEAFLSRREQRYCTDETNEETAYTRNRIRHLVLPILEEQINSQTVRHINETISRMWELEDYMEEQTRKAFALCVGMHTIKPPEERPYTQEGEVEGCLIRKAPFQELPPVLKKRLIRVCLESVTGQMKDIGARHVEAVQELFEKQVGTGCDLPYQMRAVREYSGVRVKKKNPEGREEPSICETRLCVPGETILPGEGLRICCEIFDRPVPFSDRDIPQKDYTKWFDYDIIKDNPVIRTRREGDRLGIDSAGHSQKLKTWFINEKIPARQREHILLLADGKQIMWVLGYRMSGAFRVSGATKKILQIKVTDQNQGKSDGEEPSRGR